MKFRTRQSYYLRTGPYSSLQLVLYLDPAHVHWMNTDVLSRMLVALKERIPVQLEKEVHDTSASKAKQRNKIEVYRGTGYQIAFYFRKTSQKHVVLLKNRQFVTGSRTTSDTVPLPSTSSKRTRADASENGASKSNPAPPAKRRPGAPPEGEDDDLVFVKDEPVEEDLQGVEGGWGEEEQAEDGLKEEGEGDEKPQLKVNYHGYSIYGKSLVVIVEPYPPLAAHEKAPRRTAAPEIRQLSASVQPESSRRHPSVFHTGRDTTAPRESMPPPPVPPKGNALFRERSESVDTTIDLTEEGDDGYEGLREMGMRLANDSEGEEGDELDDGPSLDELLRRRAASAQPASGA